MNFFVALIYIYFRFLNHYFINFINLENLENFSH